MVDYGSGGGPSTSKTNWVCPNDRHLALRAKLRKGWSVKTQQEECFPRQNVILDEHEQEVIRSVIQRAEELEHQEQERLGTPSKDTKEACNVPDNARNSGPRDTRIIERLDNMRRNAVGTGANQCILCGTQLFFLGLITTSCLVCYDCKKAVCQKCAVECTPYTPLAVKSSRASKASQASSSKKGSIWRCKICAETREMWKKSGAWFVKGVPKYILPPKKPPPPEGKYSPGRRVGYEKSNWARALSTRPSEGEEESSSDEDRATKFLASRAKKSDDKTQNQYLSLRSSGSSSSPFEKKSPGGRSSDSLVASDVLPFHGEEEKTIGYKGCKFKKGSLQSYKRETSQNSESGSSSTAAGHYHRTQSSESEGSKGSLQLTKSSTSYNGDQAISLDTEQATALHISAKYNYGRQDSQLSLLTTRDWCSESDRASLSGSSLSGYKGITEDTGEELVVSTANSKSIGSLGSIEFTLIYDSVATSIHVSLHRAKNLKPMDINGLADPFCKLNLLPATTKSHRLRTRTVHKTRNPEFNETLTFYGVTESDMITRALHILVLDDDKYGYDFMGEARFPLAHLRPDASKQLSFYLEKHFPVENEEFVWGEERSSHGQILITLCFSTRRKALLVGIVRCTNLPPMDNNGFSDPFVKLCLKPDATHKKCKTSVKWKNLNPVFHEEFSFETKMQELAQQTLVISVWDKDYGKSNDYLGCLELGCKSKGERLRHWIDMIKFPDHKHEGWHNLCEDQPPPQ